MGKRKTMVIAAAVIGAASMVSYTNAALAHRGDLHHWFEHQRAMLDGGPMSVDETDARKQVEVQNGGTRVAAEAMGVTQAPWDCLTEELKRGEGYTPDSECDRGARRTSDAQLGVLK